MSRVWPRALMVDSERSWRGGQEQVRLLIKGIVEGGGAVTLAAPGDGALFQRVGGPGVSRVSWNPGMAGLPVLRRAMASGGFDVVHSHASRAHGAVAMVRATMAFSPPHVVSRRVEMPVGRGPFGGWKYRRGAEAYIAISSPVRESLLDAGVPAGCITVVPDGIDLGEVSARRAPALVRDEFSLDAGVHVVGNIAALTEEKSQADLLRAAVSVLAARRDVRFFLVGEGSSRAQLEGLARELAISDRVVFTGFRNDALDLLGMFDVFVMSSRHEGLGTSIMNAQAAGVPVVATRAGGIPEIVQDGASGLLVPPGDPKSLAAAILRMLDDESLRLRCTAGGRERARGYDYHGMVYNTLDVYRRLRPTDHPCEKKEVPR